MNDTSALSRVGREGLRVSGMVIPMAFFRHGRPGRRFAVFPEHLGRLIHVRTADLGLIEDAYRSYAATRRQKAGNTNLTAGRPRAAPFRNARFRGEDKPADSVVRRSDEAPADEPAVEQRLSTEELLRSEHYELQQANAVAERLVSLKALLAGSRRAFADQRLRELQERHGLHLRKCLQLRSLLAARVSAAADSRNQTHRCLVES